MANDVVRLLYSRLTLRHAYSAHCAAAAKDIAVTSFPHYAVYCSFQCASERL